MRFLNILAVAILTFTGVSTFQAQDTGKATYYANRFHGRRTSDGSIYHKDSLTCAHNTYPLGTMLRVKNPQNGREVMVKVTDRGGFGGKRVIDLSRAAAEQLDMIRAGIINVEIAKVEDIHIPFKNTDVRKLPKLQLDRDGADAPVISIWQDQLKASDSNKVLAQNYPQRISAPVFKQHAKDSVPRYRILEGRLSAAASAAKNEPFYLKK